MKTVTMAGAALCLIACSGLVGCQLAGSLVPGGAAEPAPGTGNEIPTVTADEDDPNDIVQLIRALDELEQLLADGKLETYARESRRINYDFDIKKRYAGTRKEAPLRERLAALDARAFGAIGGKLATWTQGGVRVTTGVDADALEVAEAAVKACQLAAAISPTGKEPPTARLEQAVGVYHDAAQKALKLHPDALRYLGEVNVDPAGRLLECEAKIAARAIDFADIYVPQVPDSYEQETGCGKMEWLADGVRIGGGRFAPYQRTPGGQGYAEPIPCGKLARKSRYPRELARAVAEYEQYNRLQDVVVVVDGKPFIEEKKEDLRLHRYQRLIAYSRSFRFRKNPCGEENVFCEAGGSKSAGEYNQLEHHLDRAAVHAGVRPDRCKEQLRAAKDRHTVFERTRADLQRRGRWVSGATYRTRKGATLTEQQLVAAFAEKAALADERLNSRWCQSKPE